MSFTTNESQILSILNEKKRAVVLGLGISNLPLIRFLINAGISVTACDKKEEKDLKNIEELSLPGVTLSAGENYLSPLGQGDFVIFRSPGIRPDIPEIYEAVQRGCFLASEMELFFELCPAKIIGVTGSDGKTTTTTLIYKMLSLECDKRGYGKVYVGGNIGTPLLPQVYNMNSDDFAVVELSSFQLMTMKKSPDISVITNITPNHLNWHTDMDEYSKAKYNILGNNCTLLITNADCEVTASIKDTPDTIWFSRKKKPISKKAIFLKDGNIILKNGNQELPIISTKDIVIPGLHNVENYMAAIGATSEFVSKETVCEIARTFPGVEHRCEFVREINGVQYYNSSIDSSPSRTAAALSSFEKKVIVIVGGQDKHLDLAPLAKTLCERAKKVVLTGDSVNMVKEALDKYPGYINSDLEVFVCDDFAEAVKCAHDIADTGDTVILSPAFTSFDRFKNFEERGRLFKSIVNSF